MKKFKSQLSNQVQLQYELEPYNATNQKVTWNSSDPSIATVNSQGIVKSLKLGVCTISVHTDDNDFIDQCQVIVNPYLPDIELDKNEIIMLEDDSDSISITSDIITNTVFWSLSNTNNSILDNNYLTLTISEDKKTVSILSKELTTNVNTFIYLYYASKIITIPVEINRATASLIYTTNEFLSNDKNIKNRRSLTGVTYTSGNPNYIHTYAFDCNILNKLNIPFTIEFNTEDRYFYPIKLSDNTNNQVNLIYKDKSIDAKFSKNNRYLKINVNIKYTNNRGIEKTTNNILLQSIVDQDDSNCLQTLNSVNKTVISTLETKIDWLPQIIETPDNLLTVNDIYIENVNQVGTGIIIDKNNITIPAQSYGTEKIKTTSLIFDKYGNVWDTISNLIIKKYDIPEQDIWYDWINNPRQFVSGLDLPLGISNATELRVLPLINPITTAGSQNIIRIGGRGEGSWIVNRNKSGTFPVGIVIESVTNISYTQGIIYYLQALISKGSIQVRIDSTTNNWYTIVNN